MLLIYNNRLYRPCCLHPLLSALCRADRRDLDSGRRLQVRDVARPAPPLLLLGQRIAPASSSAAAAAAAAATFSVVGVAAAVDDRVPEQRLADDPVRLPRQADVRVALVLALFLQKMSSWSKPTTSSKRRWPFCTMRSASSLRILLTQPGPS